MTNEQSNVIQGNTVVSSKKKVNMAFNTFSLVRDKMDVFIQLRTEKHGDENVSAYDARLSGNFSNSILLKLHEGLRDAFYKESDQQREIDGFAKELRFPRIAKPVHWDLEIPRVILRLHDSTDPHEDLLLERGVADKFVFEMLEGGTVKLAFRVKLAEVSDDQLIKLNRANGQEFLVSFEMAPVEETPDNFEQAMLLAEEPMSDARAMAESAFSAPPPAVSTPDEVVHAEEWTNGPTVAAKPKRKKAAGPSLTVVE